MLFIEVHSYVPCSLFAFLAKAARISANLQKSPWGPPPPPPASQPCYYQPAKKKTKKHFTPVKYYTECCKQGVFSPLHNNWIIGNYCLPLTGDCLCSRETAWVSWFSDKGQQNERTHCRKKLKSTIQEVLHIVFQVFQFRTDGVMIGEKFNFQKEKWKWKEWIDSSSCAVSIWDYPWGSQSKHTCKQFVDDKVDSVNSAGIHDSSGAKLSSSICLVWLLSCEGKTEWTIRTSLCWYRKWEISDSCQQKCIRLRQKSACMVMDSSITCPEKKEADKSYKMSCCVSSTSDWAGEREIKAVEHFL